MELNIAGGLALRTFTRSLSTLLRLSSPGSTSGDIDFTCTPSRLSLSVVNPSRTAFGVAHFYQPFFAHYRVQGTDKAKAFKFAVTGKALLQALRPRSSNTVESISLSVGPDDPGALVHAAEDGGSSRSGETGEGGDEGVFTGGECRVVVKIFCQHGVVKTHRLTYSNANVNNWAKFDKSQCSSTWTASGRVLKDWLDHFHLRGGPGGGGGDGKGGGTDEITFYHESELCRLKSFNESAVGGFEAHDPLNSRPLSTELIVDTEDFDEYDINATGAGGAGSGSTASQASEVVTFGLREFKAIISLSDSSSGGFSSHSHSHNSSSASLPLTAHFTTGGRPLLFSLQGDQWEGKFVVATTDYDSGGSSGGGSRGGSVKRESEVAASRAGSVASAQVGPGPATTAGRRAAPAVAAAAPAKGDARRPLFNVPTPSPVPQSQPRPSAAAAEEDDEDEYGGGFDDFGDGFFDEVDRLSQVALSQQQPQAPPPPPPPPVGRVLVRDTSEAGPSGASGAGAGAGVGEKEEEGEPDTEDEDDEGAGTAPLWTTQNEGLGPTQYPKDREEEGGGRPAKRPRWNLLGDA